MKNNKTLLISLVVLILIGVSLILVQLNENNIRTDMKDNTTSRKTSKMTTTRPLKDFQLSLENKSCNSKTKKIYEYEDGRIIYSRCGDISIIIDDETYTLKQALDSGLIIIENITDNMTLTLAAFDGGTNVFEYRGSDEAFSTDSFQFERCREIQGSHDMLFLSIHSGNYMCA